MFCFVLLAWLWTGNLTDVVGRFAADKVRHRFAARGVTKKDFLISRA
jgi:hypothetical protein